MKLVLSACALALVAASSAAGSSVPVTVPQGLHAFEYVADEGVRPDHTYSEMPAFAWAPARGASKYELQLATSRRFNEATLVSDLADDRSGRLDPGSGAVDDRQPVCPLGARACALRHAHVAVEHTVRLQHTLAQRSRAPLVRRTVSSAGRPSTARPATRCSTSACPAASTSTSRRSRTSPTSANGGRSTKAWQRTSSGACARCASSSHGRAAERRADREVRPVLADLHDADVRLPTRTRRSPASPPARTSTRPPRRRTRIS